MCVLLSNKNQKIPRSNKLCLVSNYTAHLFPRNPSNNNNNKGGGTEIMYSFAVAFVYIYHTQEIINWRIEFCFCFLVKKTCAHYWHFLSFFFKLILSSTISPARHSLEHSIHAYLPIDIFLIWFIWRLNLAGIWWPYNIIRFHARPGTVWRKSRQVLHFSIWKTRFYPNFSRENRCQSRPVRFTFDISRWVDDSDSFAPLSEKLEKTLTYLMLYSR